MTSKIQIFLLFCFLMIIGFAASRAGHSDKSYSQSAQPQEVPGEGHLFMKSNPVLPATDVVTTPETTTNLVTDKAETPSDKGAPASQPTGEAPPPAEGAWK